MIVTTWNVNSLRARMPRVLEFLDVHAPDVLLLQETKTAPEQYPHLDLQAAGYTSIDHSGGRWAGVSVMVKDGHEVDGVQIGLPDTPVSDEARWVEARVDGVTFASVYVVNGRTLDDPMFPLKLDFLDAMTDRLRDLVAAGPTIVGGDFNIAPTDEDVWDPAAFVGGTHVTDHERSRLSGMLDVGMVDAFRVCTPEGAGYTWWDYRAGNFHKGFGLRIDLFLVSKDLADGINSCAIDRDFRKGTKPSDHAPLLLDLTRSAT